MKSFYWSGALLTFFFIYQGHWNPLTLLQQILLGLFLAQVLFAQALVLYPLYPKDAAGPGIQLQFQKALVPIAYIWPSFMILLWLKPFTWILLGFNLLLVPISAVACILLYFHSIDPDPSHPNELSGNHVPHH